MTDFYDKGYRAGRGPRPARLDRLPSNDGEIYDLNRGMDDGLRRRRIAKEFEWEEDNG